MRLLRYYRFQDIVNIIYWIVITIIVVIFSTRITYFKQLLLLNSFFIISGMVIFRMIHGLSESKASLIRVIYYTVAILSAFTSLGYFVEYVNPVRREDVLVAIDERLFQGVNPVEWLQKFQNPYLTEYLQIAYASYFFIPFVLITVLHSKMQFKNLNIFMSAILLGFYFNFFGYILVPIRSPYLIAELEKDRNIVKFDEPLKGVYLTDKIRRGIESLEKFKGNCFPSGHTSLSLVTLIFAFMYHRKTFYLLLPLISSIIFSTVYLRYHYVIDLIAGAGLALLVVVSAPTLYNMWEKKRANLFCFCTGSSREKIT